VKSRILMCIAAMTLLAALAIPVGLRVAAQEQPGKQQGNEEHHRYKLVDIGTFGGPVNYLQNDFSGAGLGVSASLDNLGAVVGAADTSTPDPNYGHGSGFFPLDPLIMHAFQWQKGVLTDLGALPGGNNSFTTWISPNGLIAGFSENGVIDPYFGLPQVNAVLWKNGKIINLGGYFSQAFAVNNRGQVVGSTFNKAGLPALNFLAFLWQDGEMQDLGTLGGPGSFAFLVNERGQVAGMSFPNSTASSNCAFPLITHPFLWDEGKMMDLGTLGGTCGLALSLNNRGQVVGQSNVAGDQTAHPFLWDKGTLSDLGTLGGTFGSAVWVNDAGEIVGGATTQNDQAFLAFLWKEGVMTNLGTVDGDACSIAADVDSQGRVVGTSAKTCAFTAADRRAFLWENGQMIDLNTFLPPISGLQQLTDGFNTNDRGEILGLGLPLGCGDEFACGHAFVLIPCGEGDDGCQGESATGVTQKSPSPATQQPTAATPANPALSGRAMLDRLRVRRFPGRRAFGPLTGPTN
jgi:probable HAF family extracellular repeat protein